MLYPHVGHTSAWTQAKDAVQIIVNAEYYAADEVFTNSGDRQQQPSFSRQDISPYFEYGLSDDWTVGGKTFLTRAAQTGGTQNTENWGIGETELFARYQLYRKGVWAASISPMVKLPSPESRSEQPIIGGPRPDVGLGVSLGRSFALLSRTHFANLDLQYRYRFGPQADQIRITQTVGLAIDEKWLLMPQLFMTLRQGQQTTGFTFSNSDDYDQTRVQLSVRYALQENLFVQLGGYRDIAGQNTGAGKGGLLALWMQY